MESTLERAGVVGRGEGKGGRERRRTIGNKKGGEEGKGRERWGERWGGGKREEGGGRGGRRLSQEKRRRARGNAHTCLVKDYQI